MALIKGFALNKDGQSFDEFFLLEKTYVLDHAPFRYF